jgi:hypothetical protein
MERAASILARWKNPRGKVAPGELVRAVWALAVGRKIAERTVGVDLVRTHLVVRVEDAVWQRQLFALRGQILRNLQRIVGQEMVEALEFRVAPRRLGPGREEAPARAAAAGDADEAAAIADPVLRAVYRKSRRGASA